MVLSPGWTTTTSDSGTITVEQDPAVQERLDEARANTQDTRNKVVDVYNQIGATYTGLVNAGRQKEAAQLRDAAERFARAGSQTGVSSDERIASLQELAGTLRVQGQGQEGELEARGIHESLAALRDLAAMDQNALSNSFKEAYSYSGSSSRRSPLIAPGQSVRNTNPRSPLRKATPRAARQVNPFFAKVFDAKLKQDNMRLMASFNRNSNQPQTTPFANWDSGAPDVARQHGEPITSPGGGVTSRALTPFSVAGQTPGVATPGAPVAGPSPLRVAQAKGRAASPLPQSPGFALGQGFKNVVPESINRLNPFAWLSGGYDQLANKFYGNESKPFNIHESPFSVGGIQSGIKSGATKAFSLFK